MKSGFCKKRIWRAAAVLLAFAIVCSGAFAFAGEASGDNAAVVRAEYPEMAPYPDETKYYGITGSFDDRGFSKAYDAWLQDRRSRQQQEGYQEGLHVFFKRSSAQLLSGTEGENRVYSPLNVYMALGMLAELTDGNSRQQLLDVIGADGMETLRKQAAAVWNANYCADGAVNSLLASSVWLADDMSYRRETLELLADNYYASSFRGTMGSEEYNRAFQEWLNEQTGELLKEQASGMKFNSDTVLALATAVLFQAKWQHEFPKGKTEQGIFHAAGVDESCDFMHQSDTQTYYWGEKFTSVYKGLRQSGGMWFVLPDEGVSLEELLADEEAMDFLFPADADREGWEKSKYMVVNLSVPKFDVTSQIDLSSGLQALGITDVFDASAADFSPMADDAEGVYVSAAEHDVRVMIDEEGCTAAAYTVIAEAGAGMPPEEEVDFVLDRPFLFMISGSDGLPLFVGSVATVQPG